jgi:hypothetical protein
VLHVECRKQIPSTPGWYVPCNTHYLIPYYICMESHNDPRRHSLGINWTRHTDAPFSLCILCLYLHRNVPKGVLISSYSYILQGSRRYVITRRSNITDRCNTSEGTSDLLVTFISYRSYYIYGAGRKVHKFITKTGTLLGYFTAKYQIL